MADTFDKLEEDSLAVASETGYRKNTSFRIGNLFYRILQFLRNLFGGTYLLGEKETELEIKQITNAVKGDTYKALDTGNYWTYNGREWVNIGKILPSDAASKSDIFPPITADGKGKRLIDAFWGASIYKDSPWQIMKLNKDTGEVVIRRTDNWASFSGQAVNMKGVELVKVGANNNCMFLVINWDIPDNNINNSNNASGYARFNIGYPVSEIGKRIFGMFENKQFRLTDNVKYNDDGILQSCDCVWSDGISGVMTLSTYDAATLEYRDCSVTYLAFTIKYGTRTLNELGETIKQGLLNIY